MGGWGIVAVCVKSEVGGHRGKSEVSEGGCVRVRWETSKRVR